FDGPFRYDTPYTWGLMHNNNYQQWVLFSAYLAFNFRGTNTQASLDGLTDDLLFKWAHGDRFLTSLRSRLSNDSCSTCAQKAYFNPGGVGLDENSRLDLLLHNWRVANYVDCDTLDEGQYGINNQFSFHPKSVVGAWADWDG